MYGADVTRLYILYKAPPQDVLEYDTTSIIGMHRWVLKLSRMVELVSSRFRRVPEAEDLSKRDSWTKEEKRTYLVTQKAIKKINGKMRFKLDIPKDVASDENALKDTIFGLEQTKKWLVDRTSGNKLEIKKMIYVGDGKLVNVIAK
ncbi:Leucine-tRNA ligase [Smittium culicis]|uniref:leucine--tRNA ligase n=1 Tax=Smittium culicis TaxID=133412 RepID=A0A1R1WXW4_9FUNG|nr:Leucine-tRNA ligase [Smittium culicis]